MSAREGPASHGVLPRWWPRVRSVSARGLGLTAAMLVLWPSPASWDLTGIPLERWVGGVWIEGVALAVCVTTMFLPRKWPGPARHQLVRVGIVVATTVAIVGVLLKSLLFLFPAPGFTACLRLPGIPPEQACERSWAYPADSALTRVDRVIDVPASSGLGQSAWDLSSVNATQYNYFTPAQPNRDRLSLEGSWEGRLADSTSPLAVTYVGEGAVTLDGQTIALPASYAQAQTVDIPAGSAIRIDFAFRSEATNADGPQSAPYAALQLTTSDGRFATAADPSPLSRALAVTAAAITLLVLVLLALLIAGFLWLRRSVIRAAVWRSPSGSAPWAWAMLAATAAAIAATARLQAAPAYACATVVILLTVSALLRATPTAVVRVLSSLVVSATALAMTVSLTRGTSSVTLRSGGSDPLTYEGQAHPILTTGSLHGGESVFVYSPGFRYLIALQHLIVGDGDRAFVTLGIAGVLAGCVFACWWLERPLRARTTPVRPTRILAVILAVCLLGILVASPDVLLGSRTLLSEYPTWIGLLFAVPLVLTGRRGWPLVAAGLLIGLILTMRGDQVLGLLLLLAIALVRQWAPRRRVLEPAPAVRRGWPWTALTVVAFTVPAILPAIHNIAYGRQFVLLQTSIPLPVNFPLPPSTWPLVFHDPTVQRTLVDQLAGVLVILGVHPEGTTSPLFLLAVRGIQVALVGVVSVAVARRFAGGWRRVVIVLVPLTFLLPHVFIQVYVYYPRHVVAGYLVAAICLLALAGWAAGKGSIVSAAHTTTGIDMPATGSSERGRSRPPDSDRAR